MRSTFLILIIIITHFPFLRTWRLASPVHDADDEKLDSHFLYEEYEAIKRERWRWQSSTEWRIGMRWFFHEYIIACHISSYCRCVTQHNRNPMANTLNSLAYDRHRITTQRLWERADDLMMFIYHCENGVSQL